MTTETATLLAVLAVPIAVLAAIGAVALVRLARQGRPRLVASGTGLERQEVAVRAQVVSARGAAERTATALAALRSQGGTLDADLVRWTADLSAQRQVIQRLDPGRLGPAIRIVQLAGTLARVALLWRSPAR